MTLDLTTAVWYAWRMTEQNSGNVPQTIDSNGNIVPVPNGPSRWASPRKYNCTHEGCDNQSKRLSVKGKAHNCCNQHEHDHDNPDSMPDNYWKAVTK